MVFREFWVVSRKLQCFYGFLLAQVKEAFETTLLYGCFGILSAC